MPRESCTPEATARYDDGARVRNLRLWRFPICWKRLQSWRGLVRSAAVHSIQAMFSLSEDPSADEGCDSGNDDEESPFLLTKTPREEEKVHSRRPCCTSVIQSGAWMWLCSAVSVVLAVVGTWYIATHTTPTVLVRKELRELSSQELTTLSAAMWRTHRTDTYFQVLKLRASRHPSHAAVYASVCMP